MDEILASSSQPCIFLLSLLLLCHCGSPAALNGGGGNLVGKGLRVERLAASVALLPAALDARHHTSSRSLEHHLPLNTLLLLLFEPHYYGRHTSMKTYNNSIGGREVAEGWNVSYRSKSSCMRSSTIAAGQSCILEDTRSSSSKYAKSNIILPF